MDLNLPSTGTGTGCPTSLNMLTDAHRDCMNCLVIVSGMCACGINDVTDSVTAGVLSCPPPGDIVGPVFHATVGAGVTNYCGGADNGRDVGT